MISYSQIQNIASDLEFASTILLHHPAIGCVDRTSDPLAMDLGRAADSAKLAAEILNHLTVEQVESLPIYLRAA